MKVPYPTRLAGGLTLKQYWVPGALPIKTNDGGRVAWAGGLPLNQIGWHGPAPFAGPLPSRGDAPNEF